MGTYEVKNILQNVEYSSTFSRKMGYVFLQQELTGFLIPTCTGRGKSIDAGRSGIINRGFGSEMLFTEVGV